MELPSLVAPGAAMRLVQARASGAVARVAAIAIADRVIADFIGIKCRDEKM